MTKRLHIKQFQSEQYKVAEERMRTDTCRAYCIWMSAAGWKCMRAETPKFKRYQII